MVALGLGDDPMRTPLIGIALSPAPGNAAYVPISHRYLGAPEQLRLEDAAEVLRPLFADPEGRMMGLWRHAG